MRPIGGQRRTSCVMVLEDREEGGLVSDVGDLIVVEIVEALDEGCWSSEHCDECRLIMRDEAVEKHD